MSEAGGTASAARTVVVVALDAHDRTLWQQRLTLSADMPSFTVGRSVEADVALNDERAAALHARLTLTPDGRFLATDLGSKNGIVTGRKRAHGAVDLPLQDNRLDVGWTRLLLRSAHEELAPEKHDLSNSGLALGAPLWLAAAGGAAFALQWAYGGWLGAPHDLVPAIVYALLPVMGVVVAWTSLWSLLSRVTLGDWRWLMHATIVTCVGALYFAINGVLNFGQFVFSMPSLGGLSMVTLAAAVALGLYLHLRQSTSIKAQQIAIVTCLMPALALGGSLWLKSRGALTNVNELEVATHLYPPSLRLSGATSVDTFFKAASALQQTSIARRREMQKADPIDDDPR